MARTPYYPDDQDVEDRVKIGGRRGTLYWRPYRGLVIVQSVPSRISKSTKEALKWGSLWLKIMNVFWNYSPMIVRKSMEKLSQKSKIPARDWFMSFQQGHVFSYIIDDRTEVFSMYTRDKYSRSLDVFGQGTGSILYREEDVWRTLPIGNEGEVLSVLNGRPSWIASQSGTGGDKWIISKCMPVFGGDEGNIDGLIHAAVLLPDRTSSVTFTRYNDGNNISLIRWLFRVQYLGTGNIVLRLRTYNQRPVGTLITIDDDEIIIQAVPNQHKLYIVEYEPPGNYADAVLVAYRMERRGADSRDTLNSSILVPGAYVT